MGEILVLIGAFVIFTGALGFLRFPETLQRFHPPTKMSLLGLGLIVLGVDLEVGLRTHEWNFRELLIFPILAFVGPLAAHLLARAYLKSR